MSSKVVFLTGSGLSADSGIPTFRGKEGLYKGMLAEDIVSAVTLMKSPEIVHRFCDDMRVGLRGIEPNEAHRMITRLSLEYGERVIHLTQNIDPMMELAGHPDTVHLHGFLTRLRSAMKPKIQVDIGFKRYWDGVLGDAPDLGFQFRCPKTNAFFRPDVVLFHEHAPEYAKLKKVMNSLTEADILVVIGTQGVVLPVNRFAHQSRSMKILNNLHRSDDIEETLFHHVFMERASSASSKIEEIVRMKLGPATSPVPTI